MLSVFKEKLIMHLLHYQHTFEEQELIYMGKERASDNIVDRPFDQLLVSQVLSVTEFDSCYKIHRWILRI